MSERDNRDLIRVVHVSSALGLGLMAAFLASTRQVTPEFRFELSIWTFLSFGGASGFSVLYWRTIFGPAGRKVAATGNASGRAHRGIILGGLALFLCTGTAFAFLFALKDIRAEKAREVIEGTLLAGVFLAGLGVLLWRIAKFLDAHDEAEIRRLERESEEKPPP